MSKGTEIEDGAPKGPVVGEFEQPPPLDPDAEERSDALPEQEAFWRPPIRFGSVPVEKEPLGWNRHKGFRKLFPAVYLPFQVVERVSFGHPALDPNQLFWGDNLHVMRQLPSESIDLIYVDPPFFSGRNYNVIFGDQNELRSFSDIWEGGMPGYLIWLNARLYEMKRLLRKTGSILVHCDWHASHYIKQEMDRIFGFSAFQNNLVWYYRGGGVSRERFGRKHDDILWYSRGSKWTFNLDAVRQPYSDEILSRPPSSYLKSHRNQNTKIYEGYSLDPKGKIPDDVLQIPILNPSARERIGYPTQKPEQLLEYLIGGLSHAEETWQISSMEAARR